MLDLDYVALNAQKIFEVLTSSGNSAQSFSYATRIGCQTLETACRHEPFFKKLKDIEDLENDEYESEIQKIQSDLDALESFLEAERQLLNSVSFSNGVSDLIISELSDCIKRSNAAKIHVPQLRAKIEAVQDMACQWNQQGMNPYFGLSLQDDYNERSNFFGEKSSGIFYCISGVISIALNINLISQNQTLSTISTMFGSVIFDKGFNAVFGDNRESNLYGRIVNQNSREQR